MPTYEYVCEACDHSFDQFQSITAKELRKCPACGKARLKRLIGVGAGIIFKGSGFYETDYRSANYRKGAKADQDPAKPGGAAKDAKGSKPDGGGTSTSEPASTKSPAKKSTAAGE